MKKKRIIRAAAVAAALTALLTVALALSACGVGGAVVEPEFGYYGSAGQSSVLGGCEILDVNGSTALVSRTDGGKTTYALYSFRNDALIADFSENAPNYDGTSYPGNGSMLYYRAASDGKLSVYSESGYICDAESVSDISPVVRGVISRVRTAEGGYKYVDLERGSVTSVTEGLVDCVASADYVTDDHIVSSGGSDGIIRVYDRDTFELVRMIDAAHSIPVSAADGSSAAVLGNGDLFVQLAFDVPYSADYDFADESHAYNVVTYIVDISSGRIKERNVDFLVDGLLNAYEESVYGEMYSCDNIAMISPIEDGRLLPSSIVELSNSLSVGANFTETFGVADDMLVYLGDGKFYDSEADRIYDESGRVVAADVDMLNARFFAKAAGSDKVYVYDVRTMESINADGFDSSTDFISAYGDVLLILTERDGNDGYMTYDAGKGVMSEFKAGTVNDANFEDCGVFTVLRDGKYELVAANGETGVKTLLSGFDFDFSLTGFWWTEADGTHTGALASSSKDGSSVYYRLTA